MRKLMLWSESHPAHVVAILLLVSVVAAVRLPQLRIDTSIEGLMPKSGPAVAPYHAAMEKFGSDRIALIFVKDRALFTPEKLRALDEMISELEQDDDIEDVESIFSVNDFKGVAGSLQTGPLLEWVPQTGEEAVRVRQNAIANPILVGNLVSADGTATAVNVYLRDAAGRPNFMATVSKRIETVIAPYVSEFDTIFQTGLPFSIMIQERMIKADQTVLIPLSVLVILLTLGFMLRSASGAVLPILTAGTGILWTFGFMAYAGLPMTSLTGIVPSLMLVVGSTEDIHLLAMYLEGVEGPARGDRHRAIEHMIGRVATPMSLTGVTTFLGFLAIALTPVSLMQQFAVVAAFGLGANALVTFLLAPVYLRYFGPKPRRGRGRPVVARAFDALASFIVGVVRRHKRLILVSILGVSAASALISLRLKADNNPELFFKEGSPVLEQVKILRASMAGASTMFITIDSDEPGAFEKPENLAKVEQFVAFMNEQRWFDKIVTLSDYIKLLHRETNDGKPEFHAVPHSAESIAEYLLFLHRDDIDRYVTPEFDDLNILVRHNVRSAHDMLAIVEVLEKKAAEIFPPSLHVNFTGTGLLVNRAAQEIARGHVQGIGFVTLTVFILMSILFTQVKAGFLSLLPNLVPVAVIYAVMVAFAIPLDVGTAMISEIAIGIAVDDTIHMFAHYNESMRELQDQEAAMEATVRSEVEPVVCTSVALACGFGVLGFSSFMPIVHFGVLAAVVMIVALVADLFMTPILLSSTQLITIWDRVRLHLQKEALATSEVFAGLRPSQVKTIVLLGRLAEKDPGAPIVRAGDHGTSLFIVLDGQGRVSVRDPRAATGFDVARLGPGDVFGEMALVEPGPRAATVEAVSALRCIEIDWEGLSRIRRLYPRIASKLFLNLSRILGKRLGATDRMLMEARGALQAQVERRRALEISGHDR